MTDSKNVRTDVGGSDEISLGEIFNALLQRWVLIASIFVAVLVIGVAYALLARPVYQADALIQVEDQKGSALSGLSQLSEFIGVQQSSVSGELEILRSREVLMKAVQGTRADLLVEVDNRFPLIGEWFARRYSDDGVAAPKLGLSGYAWGGEQIDVAEFNVPSGAWGQPFFVIASENGFTLVDEEGNGLAEGAVGERVNFSINGQDATLALKVLQARPGTRFRVQKNSPYETAELIRQKLSATEAGKQSNVIRLRYEAYDQQFAQDLVNAIARAYLAQNVERRSAEARSSLQFLETQLPELKRTVDSMEESLSNYRSKSGTIAINKEAEGLLQQAISLENNRLELELKRDELLQRFKPEHPSVKAIQQQLAQVQQASNRLNGSIDKLPQAQKDLLRLERDAKVNTELYISLLNNAQELKIAEAGTVGNVRIIDFAVPNNKPVAPKKALIVAASAVLGLMLGIFAALVMRFLRPAIQRSEQIEQGTGLTTYVTVPESDTQRRFRISTRRSRKTLPGEAAGANVLALSQPDDPAVESLRSLRTGLAFALMGAEGKVLVITGATAGVGKSFISTNLAALLAANGKRVLLVDTDLRRPRLAEYFAYERKENGLSNVLAGTAELDAVIRPIVQNLDVMPAGSTPPNPGELLLSDRFAEMLKQLEGRYDHILLDTPPILPVADTLAVMQYAAVAFMVARAEQTTVNELRDAMAKLNSAGVAESMKGVIFNGVRRNRLGYGSSYKYYYSYK
ncbi:polysaccharide biosynthesis tyrosine autokinase [Kerstersia gyiorum]|uniref:polysaccharide biosynthesis tyrosine autokinase n=1 Tax=Kerstersia gyiorum TaxID=206506 RepID=UPI00214F7A1B|nr:polysaccharide biosynthesis tyrosine autokinase [Kerstersia gyiorum]MCR4159735.1 polysaccharide biosynthesis tyrosine autokinase [Kerstersia gyiorum]